jgi:hypothetical protein
MVRLFFLARRRGGLEISGDPVPFLDGVEPERMMMIVEQIAQ